MFLQFNKRADKVMCVYVFVQSCFDRNMGKRVDTSSRVDMQRRVSTRLETVAISALYLMKGFDSRMALNFEQGNRTVCRRLHYTFRPSVRDAVLCSGRSLLKLDPISKSRAVF